MKHIALKVLRIEAAAIERVASRLNDNFLRALDLIAACNGRLICTGMGKSGLICQKVAATFTSTGTPAHFLHPAEAIHGDLGMVQADDLVLAISYSGETEELLRLCELLKRIGTPMISLTGNLQSTLARSSDVALDVGVEQEACPIGLAPTASTTAALAMGDALAMAMMARKGFGADDFAVLHPGGDIGRKLLRVGQLMHTGDSMPAVNFDTSMKDVIYEISRKGLGMAAVLDEKGRPAGIVTDGDLRRLLEKGGDILTSTAEKCMHRNPITISPDEFATTALRMMEQRKITSLLVTGADGKAAGVIHLHDLWRTQMI
ncbi:MAG: KpsF/GutQ family sugar-phosphate isomerase [Acidobacteriota bacterium]